MHTISTPTKVRLITLGLVTLVLGVGHVEAAPTAPLVPQLKPAKAPELVTRFHDALAKGLRSAGVEIVPTATIRAKAKAACANPRCGLRSLSHLGVDRVALCHIDTVGKNYAFTLKLLSRNTTLATVRGRCDICTLMEALTTTERLAKKLGKKGGAETKAAPTVPKVQRPPVPPPPPKKPTPKIDTTRSPKKSPGAGQTQVKKARHWPLWPALAAAGAGVLGLAVGIPLLSIDGDVTNCRGTPRPDGRNCSDVYRTSGAGWTMTTIGLAGLAASGVLFYLYFTSDKPEKAHAWWRNPRMLSLAPVEGGVVLGTSGTF